MASTMPLSRESTRLRSVSFHFRDGQDPTVRVRRPVGCQSARACRGEPARQACLTICNRSITFHRCSASRHSPSSPLGSTSWQTPRFGASWFLGSSGLNEVFSVTWSRWATASPSFASISVLDSACTSRGGVASLSSCWLVDPSALRRSTFGVRRRWPPCWIEKGIDDEHTNQG